MSPSKLYHLRDVHCYIMMNMKESQGGETIVGHARSNVSLDSLQCTERSLRLAGGDWKCVENV